VIGRKQPARLADGEFVVPADVVSHLGNGSTDAGARKLYNMMDKVRTARTGKKKQAPAVKGDKYLPKFADGGSVAPAASATITAPTSASAPAFSYPGSGMSLADITALGNLIARGGNTSMTSGIAASATPPIIPQTNVDIAAKLAAAQANRPTISATQPATTSDGFDAFIRNLSPEKMVELGLDPTKYGYKLNNTVGRRTFNTIFEQEILPGMPRGPLFEPVAQAFAGSDWYKA
jgi:hypothetical protein